MLLPSRSDLQQSCPAPHSSPKASSGVSAAGDSLTHQTGTSVLCLLPEHLLGRANPDRPREQPELSPPDLTCSRMSPHNPGTGLGAPPGHRRSSSSPCVISARSPRVLAPREAGPPGRTRGTPPHPGAKHTPGGDGARHSQGPTCPAAAWLLEQLQDNKTSPHLLQLSPKPTGPVSLAGF